LYCFDLFLRSLVTNRDRSTNSKPNTDWLPNWAVFLVGYAVFFWASLSETRMETVSPDLLMAGFLYLGVSVLLKIWAQPQNSSLYVLLGATLGLGYLAKAPFFPLAFVFFALALILTRNLRKCIPRVAAAFLVFLVVAGPWIVGLSRAKNRITFGDSGKVNYVMWVNGASPAYYFVTLGTAAGRYSHSLRQISSTPVIYEFASPVQGTLPIWYDASYWADGAVPRVLFRRQLAVVKEWLSFYLEKLITSQVALLVGEPTFLEDVELGVLALRALHEPRGGGELEGGQVLAGQEADEVRGREDGLAVDGLHPGTQAPQGRKRHRHYHRDTPGPERTRRGRAAGGVCAQRP